MSCARQMRRLVRAAGLPARLRLQPWWCRGRGAAPCCIDASFLGARASANADDTRSLCSSLARANPLMREGDAAATRARATFGPGCAKRGHAARGALLVRHACSSLERWPYLVSSLAAPRYSMSRLPETVRLNNALDDENRRRTLSVKQVQYIVDRHKDARFDHWTLVFLLRFARNAIDDPPRVRFAFGLRMLKRAINDDAQLDSFSLTQMLPVAKLCLKSTVILALKRKIEAQNHTLDVSAYSALISHFGSCGRPDLMREIFAERQRVHGVRGRPDALALKNLMFGFLKNKNTKSAREAWRLLRSPLYADHFEMDEDTLSGGTWVCASGEDNADEARWIGEAYLRLKIKPPEKQLHLLVSAFVNSHNYKEARAYMRWINKLDYTLHERRLYQYIPSCMRQERAEELLPLCDVLLAAKNLGTDGVEQLRVLLYYLRSLANCAEDSVAKLNYVEAINCAHRVVKHWRITDIPHRNTYRFLRSARIKVNLTVRDPGPRLPIGQRLPKGVARQNVMIDRSEEKRIRREERERADEKKAHFYSTIEPYHHYDE